MTSNEKARAEFEGKVVIVTGAARGMGKATALEFSRQGASLVIVDVLENELQEASKVISESGGEVLPMEADVSSHDQVQNVIKKALDRFGRIDILVNNAGIVGPIGPIVNLAEEDWDRVFNINVKSMFLFCKSIVPIMLRNRRGNIVNVGSISGKEGNKNQGAYSASKAAVICFSRVLAKEVAKDGIRVNCVAPSLIKTPMSESGPKEIIDTLIAKIPMGRAGYPEEVADLILFLSSEKSSFITGQCFNITGGRGDY